MAKDLHDELRNCVNRQKLNNESTSKIDTQLDQDLFNAEAAEEESKPSDPLDQELQQLIQQARQYPERSSERRRLANRIIYKMQQSGQIRLQGDDHYQEALQQTWIWFGKKFCEFDPVKTGNLKSPTVIGWFKYVLRLRCRPKSPSGQPPLSIDQLINDENQTTWGDLLASSEPRPDEVIEEREVLERIQVWLQQKQQKRQLKSRCVSNYPEANCYELVLKRLPVWDKQAQQFIEGETWENIVQALSIAENETQKELLQKVRRYYRSTCLPCLQKFLEAEGYSLPET